MTEYATAIAEAAARQRNADRITREVTRPRGHLTVAGALAAAWRDRAAIALPSFTDDPRVMTSAAALLALSAVSDADGSAAATAGIVADAEGLAKWARLADMSHGDVSTERDFHSWVRDVAVRYRADGTVVDTVPAHPAAPDPMEGARHTVRRGRSKRGATAVVTGRGVAHVIGSWTGTAEVDGALESLPVLAAVMGVRSGAFGCNALDVERVTARAFPELPTMIGSDVEGWRDVIHAGNGAVDEYGVTHHNPRDLFGAAGLDDDNCVGRPIMYATRGAGLLRALPHGSVRDRERAIAWIGAHRDSDSVSAARIASECTVQTFTPTTARQTTRYKLRKPRARKNDIGPRTVTLANGYCLTGIRELLAPAADIDRVWRGHTLVTRPAAIGGETVKVAGKAKRARTARVKRTAPDVLHATDRAALLARFADVPAGGRVKWTLGALSGTYTLSPNLRRNIGIKWSTGDRTASRRTITALDRIVERCEWMAAQPA